MKFIKKVSVCSLATMFAMTVAILAMLLFPVSSTAQTVTGTDRRYCH